MSDLSWDLIEEILCHVPATSLKRLHSTCKRWNRLFKDSRFTRKHFEKAAKQSLVFMLKNGRVCSMSVNLHGVPSVEATGELSLIDPFSSFDPLSSSDEDIFIPPDREIAKEPWDSLEKRFSLTNGVHVEQLEIYQVFHCDGLLLCTSEDENIIVVWNPCTGQTRWILPSNGYKTTNYYALGSYQDKKSGHNSYKVLSYDNNQKFDIYEINSDSWRTLNVTPACELLTFSCGASLKGNTYWVGYDEKEKQLGMFLVSFDYTTEKFERLLCQCPIGNYQRDVALSVVREEKLSLLLHNKDTSRTEIWVTNKIGGNKAKVVRWSNVFTVHLKPKFYTMEFLSFLVDEEKKVLVTCDISHNRRSMVFIVGEDNSVRQMEFRDESGCSPFLFNYVPSLTQIKQGLGGKRKRDE